MQMSNLKKKKSEMSIDFFLREMPKESTTQLMHKPRAELATIIIS